MKKSSKKKDRITPNADLPPTRRCGIYEIVNVTNGKRYVGSATRYSMRWYLHRKFLMIGQHHSSKLQNAWNKYGPLVFDFRIIEDVDDRRFLLAREQYYLDTLQPEYNINMTAGSRLGMKSSPEHIARLKATFATPESRARLSARWKGKKQSPEHRAARGEGMRGNKNGLGNPGMSDETRERANATRQARLDSGEIVIKHTPESKEKLRLATLAQHAANPRDTPEWSEIMRQAALKGAAKREAEHGPSKSKIEREQSVRRDSPEFGKKISAAILANAEKLTPEELAERTERCRQGGLKAAEVIREKKANGTAKERTPEQRERYRQATLAFNARRTAEEAAAALAMLQASAARMHAEMAARKEAGEIPERSPEYRAALSVAGFQGNASRRAKKAAKRESAGEMQLAIGA